MTDRRLKRQLKAAAEATGMSEHELLDLYGQQQSAASETPPAAPQRLSRPVNPLFAINRGRRAPESDILRGFRWPGEARDSDPPPSAPAGNGEA